MLKQTLLAATVVLAVACNNESNISKTNEEPGTVARHNTLTKEEQDQNWQLLFDGKSAAGWHKYGGQPAGAAWKVDAEGNLYLDASQKENGKVVGGGDIVTDEEYDNFHLKLEWKVDTAANSGIIIYVHEDSTKYRYPWETGPEMQVLDNERHPDAKITKHRAGDLYDMISCSRETVKPAGEWNQAEIISNNGNLEFYLNGEKVVSTTMWDDSWKELVANSKFKGMKDFGIYKKGRIGLQDHGDLVWFRNIKVRKL